MSVGQRHCSRKVQKKDYKINMRGRKSIFCLIITVGILLSEGMKFSHKKHMIVLTAGSDNGQVATIKVEASTSSISYNIRGAGSLMDIDKNGKLKLMKKLDNKIAAALNNTEVTIVASKQGTSEKASTIVIIIILPLYFGDQYVPQIGMVRDSSVNKNQYQFKHITPRVLLRLIRRPSETAKRISLAQLKLETKIMKIKKMIIKQIVTRFGNSVAVQTNLHIKQLFSEKMMEEMDNESDCIEPTVVNRCDYRRRYRSFDGTCNNFKYPNAGASDRGFERLLPALYFDADGLNDPIGYPNQPNAPVVPSPFAITRDFINDEVAASPSSSTLTHAVMQFGQFLDHDLDLAAEVEFEGRNSCFDVSCNGSSSDFVCPCYPILPDADARCMRVTRSAAVCQKHGYLKPREQINVNTAFIDASQVYGSTKKVADSLRQTEPEDRGLLKSSRGFDGELLPLDPSLEADEKLCGNFGGCFIAGDSRPNEQQSLAAFHSLFLREHNRIAKILKNLNNHWNGEKVYQETRSIMGAVMQKITYDDWLPLILGPNPLPEYKGYQPHVNPGVLNAFATGAFRFGHSLIRPSFDILDNGFNPIGNPIDLRFMFANNTFIQRNGINPLLLGLIGNFSKKVDRTLSPGITRHLFERENSPGNNLAALNIHRSRDHGIPGYNEFRKTCGLGFAKTFADTKNEIKDPKNIQILKRLYSIPDHVELWVAGLAETPVNGASVGPTFQCVIAKQFSRTRDGDRFYFERRGLWRTDKLAEIRKASLSSIYCKNLNVVSIQPNAFEAPTVIKPRISCERIPHIDLCKWKESRYFRYPCLHGKLGSRNGKCICVCKSPWFGNRCESKLATKVSWHATILNSKKEIVCSGALIRSNLYYQYVLTTASCAKATSKNGYVQLGDYRTMTSVAIKSIKLVHLKGLAFIRLAKKIRKNVYPITIARFVSRIQPTFLTAWGTARSILVVQTTITRREAVCKHVFDPFNAWKQFCTLPAGLPATRKTGSPLVQYYGRRPYLVGFLTDVAESSSHGARFGKYVKVTLR